MRLKNIYKGKIVSLSILDLVLPNGVSTKVEVVGHPGGAAVLPVFPNGDILLLRQYRACLNQYIWEIPAGRLEKGEIPRQTVLRELQEETGFKARSIKKILSIWTTPGFCQEVIHLFVAKGLILGKCSQERDEIIETHRFSVQKIKQLLKSGKIQDGKTLVALFYYLTNF
ncbi:MAG: NUDIX hydrolase [Deltaproteobacteria bacterium]|nr:NUDIX hydrolase [Deltaproteobacteria bacterium]